MSPLPDLDAVELPCPRCHRPTTSLKQYRAIHLMIFLLVFAWWKDATYVACPACMRSVLLNRAAINLVPANLLWFVLVLPWTLTLFVMTFQEGHSKAIEKQLREHLGSSDG